MPATIDDVLNFLAKRQEGQSLVEKQRQLQRRNTVTDAKADFQTMLRGVDRIYTAFRISNDMQYIMKYSFNLHIRPFVTNIAQNVTTSDTSLNVSGSGVSPNPHHHTVDLGVQIKEHNFELTKLRISIQGIDLTDAIIAEYGSFVNGYGYYPSQNDTFDVLRLLDYLHPWQQSVVLSPGLKEIQITQNSNMLCECEISYYIKYNHVDRGGLD
ncbi:hypothetical protein [Enterococcus pallens]|uniref:Uncharacterized protein n=1 Tax=Enterococcus pallens ATCC BAA-351 TaxID=1158607 RepID=R2S1I5_9ENTE|nr:hypothetical protein [Enterococcus pallens]EOH86691.1 hypothetical protein UAU_05136 [Enterococcus pallens ATCC BAA-351]EOU18487.1 hypothetical protein I588_03481 [Enterococcus pallens ATCC BAA-351]